MGITRYDEPTFEPPPILAVGPRGAEVRTLEQAERLARLFYRSQLTPLAWTTVDAITVAILVGAELGLAPWQSLDALAVVGGRIGLKGEAALAIVQASPECEYAQSRGYDGTPWESSYAAVFVSKRRGDPDPLVTRYGIEDARAAGLWGSNEWWLRHAKAMLFWRSVSANLRAQFADVLRGVKMVEVLRDDPPIESEWAVAAESAGMGPAEPALAPPAEPLSARARVQILAAAAVRGLDAEVLALERFRKRLDRLSADEGRRLLGELGHTEPKAAAPLPSLAELRARAARLGEEIAATPAPAPLRAARPVLAGFVSAEEAAELRELVERRGLTHRSVLRVRRVRCYTELSLVQAAEIKASLGVAA